MTPDHETTGPAGAPLYWRCYTHDWRPPVQGGDPVCTGALPVTLPPVRLDTSAAAAACAAGYHACARPADALRIGGLWPDGRPSRLVACTLSADAVTRGDKTRATGLTIVREATPDEWQAALGDLHAPFGDHADALTAEALAWRVALARPRRDAVAVAQHLRVALAARGLAGWSLQRYGTAWAAWAARAAGAARAVWAARAAWAAWDARDAWAAWDARAAGDAWDAWDAGAAWAAGGAWDAWDARAALVLWTAVRCYGLTGYDAAHLTAGLRDAYACGLGVAVPVAEGVLGWAMDDEPEVRDDA